MTATTVDDLLTGELHPDRTALIDATGREFDHHWFCKTSWQAGNFLRHQGVRNEVTVGVVGEGPFALLACFGATLLEATVRFDPPTDLSEVDDFRALVAPVEDIESGTYAFPRGGQRVGYGAKPRQANVHHFDAGVWSENPSFPPLDVEASTSMLTDGERTLTHADVLETARSVVDDHGLEAGDRVVVRDSLAMPEVVVAGVIAPLLVDGVTVLSGESSDQDEQLGTFAVSRESAPESTVIDPVAYRD
ncbi:hypothetical protein [Natrarchaeobaculum sulfurireducens]|uniref:Acyl-CoA synthetase (AMP-forming) n=1 Tax=Natrarchaeobaculum sulfurireducens TaxID=2044521 RepID=A0A346PER4_9EURY|nr:hypothetical protein [Natrarchaeobaculum sulfurireducens]AXR78009.1 Acyl-CoA synthetase (AMP-forming) [Natrarchaeobaculum sulfurireducens]